MRRLTIERIRAVRPQIDPVFLNTPQFEYGPLSDALGCRLTVKVELLNPIRSFKGRGAEAYMAGLVARGETGPVVCASAGNFGQAIAYAGTRRGIPIIVFAAEAANPLKVERMRALGAEVRLEGRDFDAAKDASRAFAEAHGHRVAVDSLDVETAEGAGTIGLELMQMPEPPRAMLIPLGNGAMINGIATAVRDADPSIRIIAVQAERAPAMVESLRAGTLITRDSADTIADGIGVRVPVPEALGDMDGLVDDSLLVSEDDMIAAMRVLHAQLGLAVEPSGAVAVGALLAHRDRFAGQHVGTVLCGGNLTDAQMKAWLAPE